MTPGKLARLVGVNLRRDKRGALFSAFGVAVGIGALVFFVALGGGVRALVRDKLFPNDARAVEVVPPKLSLSGVLGGGRLDEGTVTRLAALPGVEKAWRKMELRIPAMGGPASGLEKLNVPRNVYIAVIATGVEAGYVAADLAPGASFEDPGEGKPVPAMAARRLLELYNKSFAKAQGLTPIGEPLLMTAAGLELLTVRLGRSMRGDTGLPERHVGLTFAGLSDKAPLHGVLMPLETVRRINKDYGVEAGDYSAVTLVAQSPGEVPRIVEKVRAMGFGVDESDKKIAERIGAAVAVTTAVLALLSALICLLAAVNIAHVFSASVRARSRELGVLRAVGATRGDVALLVLAEAGVIGLLGGAIATALARAAGVALDVVARTELPEFPFKPETFFHFSPALLAGAALLGLAAALLGALVPALAASRASPAKALAG
ncbi:MAG TPA: ABC transporter permease [Myxococcales bacterium]|jgi:ABC-type antimicrobial peptide transport system permease subunit